MVPSRLRTRRRAFSLMEVLVVMTILGILCTIPMPLFAKALEQSKLDVAAANLRAMWASERLFFLQNGAFTDLATLSNEGLLDPSILSGNTYYSYRIDLGTAVTTNDQMTLWAVHPVNSRCNGSLSIDQDGNLLSQVAYVDGTIMTPSFEDRP